MTRKQPEEWRNVIDRWFPLLASGWMLVLWVFIALTGPLSIFLHVLYAFCILVGIGVQLEYEFAEGVFVE